jgi:thiol:disulfide interchange protein DsbD
MKKTLLLILSIVAFSFVKAQIEDPVSWSYEAKKKSENTYELVITATVSKPWHIYSQNSGADGPIPTTITINPNPLITKEVKFKEIGKLVKFFDKNFNTNVLYYSDKVVFTQTIKLKTKAKTVVTGKVDYMVCNDEKCLPPTKKSFTIKL